MDKAFEAIGSHGKYQKLLSGLIIVSAPFAYFMAIAFPLFTSLPEFECLVDGVFTECDQKEYCGLSSENRRLNLTNSLDNITVKFDLVCSREIFINVIASSYFIGVCTGTLLLSTIPDIYGREKVFKYLLYSNFLNFFSMIFCYSVYHFIAVNFFGGVISYIGIMAPLFSSEFLSNDVNSIVISIMGSGNSILGLFVTFYYIYIDDTWLLFYVIIFIVLIISLLAHFIVKESPRWLYSQNKKRDSFKVLEELNEINQAGNNLRDFIRENPKFLESNRSSCKDVLNFSKKFEKLDFSKILDVENMEEKVKTERQRFERRLSRRTSIRNLGKMRIVNILDVFNLKSQRKKLIICTYLFLTFGLFFNGLFLNLDHLGENILLNNIIYFASEASGILISGYFGDFFGRVMTMKIFSLLGGVSFIAYEFTSEPEYLKSLFLMFSSFSFSGFGNIAIIYFSEVFPTVIRSRVLGFLFLISQIGGIVVPYLSLILPNSPITYGMLSLLNFIPVLFLPETLGEPILDNLPEEKKEELFISEYEEQDELLLDSEERESNWHSERPTDSHRVILPKRS